ncbi:MAG TPA: ABC transporter ATP-binding protein [Thermoplasmata archaeon]|nr:ABC transporter ATP-binding protein [Thermoplasmata archaeon]
MNPRTYRRAMQGTDSRLLDAPPTSSRGSGEPALSVRGVSKLYGSTRALDRVSLSVPPGQIVGLLGPNGAGKSTTMKIVLGILRADEGAVTVLGHDVRQETVRVKQLVGYVPESPQLYEFLTASEYLDFVADMYGMPPTERAARIPPYLSALELTGHENSMLSGYSQGMKQKVALIAALAHRPQLLILDEPLNGLDPRSARIVKDLLRSLAEKDGVGVLFSTHVLEIAQSICDRVVIMHHGHIRAEGTVAELREQAGLKGSALEEVFLALTETSDLKDVVSALAR